MAPTELGIAQEQYARYLRTTYLIAAVLTIPVFGAGLVCLLLYRWYRNSYLPRFVASTKYTLTDETLTIRRGVFWKRESSIPLWKITDIVVSQGPIMAWFSLKLVHVQTSGQGATNIAEGQLLGLADPDSARAAILELMNSSRKQTAPHE